LQYQQFTVEHRHLQRPLQVALLRRAERDVEDRDAGRVFLQQRRKLLDLAAAEIEGRVRALAPRAQFAGDLVPRGDGQLPCLLQRIGRLVPDRAARTDDDADEKGARRALGARGFDLEGSQASDSVARLTGRAGTTVEMACL